MRVGTTKGCLDPEAPNGLLIGLGQVLIDHEIL